MNPRQTGVTVFVVRPLAENVTPSHWIGHAESPEAAARLAMLHYESWRDHRSFIVSDWDSNVVIVDANERQPLA